MTLFPAWCLIGLATGLMHLLGPGWHLRSRKLRELEDLSIL